ncbi:hypothetical protein JB92DRAFT_3144279 [Gautieria morchelliformis]|nr:hypothetical protein JB92DRAFT_3144279 [Gautieria morchelliformis]
MPPARTDSTEALTSVRRTLTGLQHVKVPRPRNVVRATPNQVAKLQAVFQNTPYPTTEVRDLLAERTGLTSDWISDWFVRKRRKSRNGTESSRPKTIGHLLGFPGPSQTPITSDAPDPTLTSTGSNSSLVNSWSHNASLPAAPLLSRSGATAQAVTPLPGLTRNYVLPLSPTDTGEAVVSTASSRVRNSGYNHPSQSYALHPPNLRQSIPPGIPIASQVSNQPHHPSLGLSESQLLTGTTLTEGDPESFNVSIETSISPTDCWQREGDTDGNAGQEGTWLVGSASPAYDTLNDVADGGLQDLAE